MLCSCTNIDIPGSGTTQGARAAAFLKRLVAVLGLAATLCAPSLLAQHSSVTAVEGDSLLGRLHRRFEETAMGKTWRLGPPLQAPEETADPAPSAPHRSSSTNTVVLHGADLYRLNCEGCHGESGLGAPPEIASIINPVRATSVALVMQRMKSVGADVSRAQATELAGQSKTALLQRIHNGGQDMPSFSYLNDFEVQSLVAYLNLLAGVPNAAARQAAVSESHARVGELIVKSTCHTCHAATGPNPAPAELAAGAIPPLATLTSRVSRAQLIRKITVGASVMMGAGSDSLRGRMPVFFYLTETEAADVYGYLEAYPPSDSKNPPVAAQVQNVQSATTTRSALPPEGTPKRRDPERADSANRTWFLYLALGVLGLFAVGIVFTQREFRRLSTQAHMRRSLRTHLVARALPIVAPQNNSWVVEKTSGRPIALVPTGRKQHSSSAKRLKDWWCPEEFGDAC
jgi:mono/diheme cytochrome c family protein